MPLLDYSFLAKILPKAKIKKDYRKAKKSYLNRIRLATSLFFFGMGFCFSTWASRIPDIKSILQLSEAGFFGALVGIMILAFELSPLEHFSVALIFVILLISTNCKYIINVKSNQEETKSNYSFFKNPDKTLLWLGVICFCGMASGIIISTGLYSAILFPYLIPCTIAFMVVGFGVSNVVPIIFNVAGNNQKVPTGIALTIVSSISFIGFLIGPPLIRFIAELTSLKYSFAIIGIFGIFITVLVSRLKIFKS